MHEIHVLNISCSISSIGVLRNGFKMCGTKFTFFFRHFSSFQHQETRSQSQKIGVMSLTLPPISETSSTSSSSYISDNSLGSNLSSTSSRRIKKDEIVVRKGKNGQISYKYKPKRSIPIEANYISQQSKDRYDRMKIIAKCSCHRILVQRILKCKYLFCDECGETIKMDEILWSCPKGNKSHKHPNGYDICKKCCIQLIIEQFQRQTYIPNYYGDDDRLPSSGECGVSCLIQ